MSNRVCLVTGANSGLGRATSEELARLGAQVVMVCRNRERGEKARSEIKKITRNQSIDLLVSDFSSLESVRDLAREYQNNYSKLHVLINNAGLVKRVHVFSMIREWVHILGREDIIESLLLV